MARKRRNAEQLRRAHETWRAPFETIFADAYRRQLRLLRAASKQETEPFNAEQWARKVSEAMRPEYRRIMNAGGRRYLRDLAPFIPPAKAASLLAKGPRRRANQVVVGLGNDFVENLAETIRTTWGQLSDTVAQAEAEGLGNNAIDLLLGETWENILGPRTELIAISAVTGSYNGIADYLGRELVELNDWITAGDDRVRVTHRLYGSAGPRGTGFNYADLSGGRYTLRFPADPQCSELREVINCRCFLVPDVTSEPEGELFDDLAAQFDQD